MQKSTDAPPSPAAEGAGGQPKRTAWPIVIGVLSILFGGLVLLGAIHPLLILFSGRQIPDSFAVIVLGEILLAAMLLMAGMCLVMRKPGGAAHIPLAVLIIVFHLGVALWFISIVSESSEMTSTGSPEINIHELSPEGIQVAWSHEKERRAVLYLYAIVTSVTLLTIAYPVFLLVWFLRRKVLLEVRSWQHGPNP